MCIWERGSRKSHTTNGVNNQIDRLSISICCRKFMDQSDKVSIVSVDLIPQLTEIYCLHIIFLLHD